MSAPITSRRLFVPAVILILLASSLMPARYSVFGPPLQNAVLILLRPLTGRLHAFGSKLHDRSGPPINRTLQQMHEEVLTLEGDLRRLTEENRKLREQITILSGLQQRLGQTQHRPVFARVTGRNADPGSESLFINVGARDGLDVGMVVADVGAGGFGGPQIVGRIVQVQPASAVVRPLTAAGTVLRLELSGEPGKWTVFRAAGPDLLLATDADRDMRINVQDTARLADDTGTDPWPSVAQFMLVGTVTLAGPDPDEPLLQRIEVRPIRPLLHVAEVMVLIPSHADRPREGGGS